MAENVHTKLLFLIWFLLISITTTGASQQNVGQQLAMVQPQTTTSVTQTEHRWQSLNPNTLKLRSKSALVIDNSGNKLFGKATDDAFPIASITKLMTAMVILDSGLALDEKITITREDRDLLRMSSSRLKCGATLTRQELLLLALMSSENRAASALARTYPGGKEGFVEDMNWKANNLRMFDSEFKDPTGLDAGNVATAKDLALMVKAAYEYPLIRQATTTVSIKVSPYSKRTNTLWFYNTNRLLQYKSWAIELSKTGYILEAGRCLVMRTKISDEKLTFVLLNSKGKLTPIEDSIRIKRWIQSGMKNS